MCPLLVSGTKSIASVVLVVNGISFAIMTAIFTTISSAADSGTFGRWLLFIATLVCWAVQYVCAFPVRYFFPSNGFITEYAIGTPRTGFCSEFGGVCVHHRHSQVAYRGLVIYQSLRPRPLLPEGESYRWKQVINLFYDPIHSIFISSSDLGRSQDL